MNNEQRKQIEDKLRKREFAELSKKPGVWIRGTTPNMRTVDFTKLSTEFPGLPIVCISTGIERIEQGHGITEIDDIRDEIAGILKHRSIDEQKEQPAPKLGVKHEKEHTEAETGKNAKTEEHKASAPEGKGEVKKMDGKTEEKGLVPQEKAKPPVTKKEMTDAERDNQIELAKAKRFLEGRGTSYIVQGKERPDAHKIQQIANERAISIEIISAVQTDIYSDIVVRGHLGEQFVDACVHHDFATEYMLKTMEIIQKNPEILDHYEGTTPIIKEGATIEVYEKGKYIRKDAKYYLVHALLSFKKFSLRDARTKAASIAEAMLLNRDWRDEDEVQSELSERVIVEETITNSQKGK